MKMLEKIKITSEKLGISIENPHSIAEKFLASGVSSDWFFFQDYNFLDFVAFWLKNHKKYAKKKSNELRSLFISAVNWNEIRQQYPQWREKQKQMAMNQEKNLQKKAIREQYPSICPKCYAHMEGDKCPNCRGFFTFDNANQKYIFNNGLPFDDITHQFLRMMEERKQAATSGPSEKVASG